MNKDKEKEMKVGYTNPMLRIKSIAAVLLIFFLFGCNSTPPYEREALDILSAYNKALYEIDQKDLPQDLQDLYPVVNERVKPYMTEKEYANFMANRDAGLAVEEAKLNKSIRVNELRITKLTVSDDKRSLSIDYTINLSITSNQTNQQTQHQFSAQATLMKESDTWKIDRHWYPFTFNELGL